MIVADVLKGTQCRADRFLQRSELAGALIYTLETDRRVGFAYWPTDVVGRGKF